MDLPDPALAPTARAAGNFTLSGEYHLHPTPAGSYFAVSRPEPTPQRQFLQALLAARSTPSLTAEWLQATTGLAGEAALAFLHQVQEAGHVQGLPQAMSVPADATHLLLPALLSQLSDEGRAVLADEAGLLIAAVGWKHAHCEQLAALCAELAALQRRHAGLRTQLGLASDGWGLVSAAGYAELTFWPLYIGEVRLHLVLGGQPRFNQQAYTKLVWALARRGAERSE